MYSELFISLFLIEILENMSNSGSPLSVHEDTEKQPQPDVKEGKTRSGAWILPNFLTTLWKKLLLWGFCAFNLSF